MHIYWGAIVWRDMSARHAWCLSDLVARCRELGIGFTNGTIYGDSLVSRARSIAASEFYRSAADVLLTVDSDILFDPDQAIALCEKALAGHDIIGGVYMKRDEAPQPACPIPAELVMDENQPPVQTSYMGTGFTATARRVVEALVPLMPLCAQASDLPFYPLYQPLVVPDDRDGYLYLSEDWAFAHRARELGFKCWIDPTVRVGHLSTSVLTMEDMLRQPKPPATPMKLLFDGAQLTIQIPTEAVTTPPTQRELELADGGSSVNARAGSYALRMTEGS